MKLTLLLSRQGAFAQEESPVYYLSPPVNPVAEIARRRFAPTMAAASPANWYGSTGVQSGSVYRQPMPYAMPTQQGGTQVVSPQQAGLQQQAAGARARAIREARKRQRERDQATSKRRQDIRVGRGVQQARGHKVFNPGDNSLAQGEQL